MSTLTVYCKAHLITNIPTFSYQKRQPIETYKP